MDLNRRNYKHTELRIYYCWCGRFASIYLISLRMEYVSVSHIIWEMGGRREGVCGRVCVEEKADWHKATIRKSLITRICPPAMNSLIMPPYVYWMLCTCRRTSQIHHAEIEFSLKFDLCCSAMWQIDCNKRKRKLLFYWFLIRNANVFFIKLIPIWCYNQIDLRDFKPKSLSIIRSIYGYFMHHSM